MKPLQRNSPPASMLSQKIIGKVGGSFRHSRASGNPGFSLYFCFRLLRALARSAGMNRNCVNELMGQHNGSSLPEQRCSHRLAVVIDPTDRELRELEAMLARCPNCSQWVPGDGPIMAVLRDSDLAPGYNAPTRL